MYIVFLQNMQKLQYISLFFSEHYLKRIITVMLVGTHLHSVTEKYAPVYGKIHLYSVVCRQKNIIPMTFCTRSDYKYCVNYLFLPLAWPGPWCCPGLVLIVCLTDVGLIRSPVWGMGSFVLISLFLSSPDKCYGYIDWSTQARRR